MLAPWFLIGLLAIGLPWWLHRLARSETTPQAFPSLMLLERSELRDTRKRQLRYLALLALRIALLVALVLAFTQPQWLTKIPAALAGQARMHVIVLDTSLSMRAGTRWQQAKEKAAQLIDAARAGDQLLLISAAGRRVQVLAGPVAGIERARVRAAMQSLTPSPERLDLGLAMASIKTWKMQHQLPMELHVVSDLQASGSPLRFADLEPPAGATLRLHTIMDDNSANAAITRVALSGGEHRALTVSMHAYGGKPGAGVIAMTVDDREFGKQAVQWQADGAASATFADLKLTPGSHRLHAELQLSDALSDDNHYYAVIEHADPRVLLVARNPQADEVTYLAAAIESLAAPRLIVTRVMPDQLSAHTLADYAAVVIADSGVLSEAVAERLSKHAVGGNALFVTLGPQALRIGADPITGMKVRELGGAMRIGAVDDSHPILREPEAWRSVRFFKRLQVTPADGDRSLLRFEDGAPLLIERSFEAGRVLLMAAPLDREWNDLAVHPLFVRFIAETARYMTGNDAAAASAQVGDTVATGVAAGAAGQIFDSQGKRVSALPDREGATHLNPTQAGFYEVRSANHSRFVAANVDTRESDLTPLATELVQKWQALEKPAIAVAASASGEQYRRDQLRRELGPLLLTLAALLALAELLVANYRLQVVRDA